MIFAESTYVALRESVPAPTKCTPPGNAMPMSLWEIPDLKCCSGARVYSLDVPYEIRRPEVPSKLENGMSAQSANKNYLGKRADFLSSDYFLKDHLLTSLPLFALIL